MLKIESKDFFPIKGDTDFKVKLRAPSWAEYQDIEIEANKAAPSGGPDVVSKPERIKAKIQKLFECCVVSIEGCMIHGVNVTTHDQLFKLAPTEILNAVAGEIANLSTPSESEIKN